MNQMTPLQEAATATHEMYTAYLEAGFTPEQALQITIAQVTAAGSRNNEQGS